LGGFIGWVGTIVCSWSYEQEITTTLNPYATVIWVAFFTTAATYLSTDAGPQGLFGPTYSHGFLGFYFSMVQSLVMLSTYIQPDTRDAVTVTRVVATIVGVVVAMVLQLIPPNCYGRYPRDIVPCLTEIKNVFKNTVDAALSLHKNNLLKSSSLSPSSTSSLYEELIVSGRQREQIEAVQKLLNHRLFLVKDSGALSFLPLMKLNPKLIPLLREITVTLDYISRLERIVFRLKENPDQQCLINELCSVMKLGQPARSSMNPTDGGITELDGASLLPGVTKLIENRLSDHERSLQSLL